MSSKNKIENKSLRRSERANLVVLDRTPVSPIAQKTSARILSNPKQKMLGSTRRRLQASRGLVVETPRAVAGSPEVKVAVKLEKLSLVRLISQLKRAARRAATCKYLLAKIHPGSRYIAPLNAEQTHQLSLCRQISAEISVRNHNTTH